MTRVSERRRHRLRWARLVAGSALGAILLAAGCGDGDADEPASAAGDGAASTSEAADADAAEGDAETAESESADNAAADNAAADNAAADAEPAESDAGGGDVETLFPDVLAAEARLDGDGTWTFSATLSSPYDTAARYADAWRVVGPDGTVFGVRELLHDHASEQPFTRSQSGIEIPPDVEVVTVEGRDQISGWGGATVEVELER